MGDFDIRDYMYRNLQESSAAAYYRGKYRTWRYSFKQILDDSLKFSSLLREKGLKKGDKVVIRAESGPHWQVVFLGCAMIGVVSVPLDLHSDKEFILKVIRDVNPKMAVFSRSLEQGTAGIPVKQIFIEDLDRETKDLETYDYRRIAVEKDDLIEIIYTSGTTSDPKGVVLTYNNIEANLKTALPLIRKWKKFVKYIPRTKLLTIVPLSHMYGQVIGIFVPASISLPVFFTYSMSPKEILKIIKTERIIALGALPHQLKTIKDHIIQAYGLDNFRFRKVFDKYKTRKWWLRYLRFFILHLRVGLSWLGIISGGAEISGEVDEFFRTIGFGLFQGYGLTETAPIIALHDPTRNKAGSIGSFIDRENIKIEEGELYVRGDSVTPGYFNDKEKTRQSFEDGWFKTGDLVEIDESGNVFFKGRKDDVIVKQSGINVYPSDIEERFKEEGEIEDCVVFGLQRESSKDIIAVLLPRNRDIEEDDIGKLVQRANSHLNVHQRIDDYFIWRGEDFPRTSTMNVKKRELLEKVKDREEGEKSKLAHELVQSYESQDRDIYSLIRKIKKSAARKNGEAVLEQDLGMDSMDIISFSSEIEKNYGIDASRLDISASTRIKDIEEQLKHPSKKGPKLPFFKFAYNRVFIIIRSVFQFIVFPLVRMTYRARIRGKQNLSALDTPTALISNHVSVMDTLILLFSLPLRLRAKMAVVMSIGHHFNHFFSGRGNVFRRFMEGLGFYLFISLYVNVIPISREFGFEQVFKNIGIAVDKGWNILIFPEGSVTEDGTLQEFEPGIGVLCRDMRLPVVPIRIDGLFNIFRNGLLPIGHMPRLPRVDVNIGRQVYLDQGSYGQIADELYRIVKDELKG